jgi:hypothetical protein
MRPDPLRVPALPFCRWNDDPFLGWFQLPRGLWILFFKENSIGVDENIQGGSECDLLGAIGSWLGC